MTSYVNASGVALNSDGIDRTFIAPIRSVPGTTPVMVYNAATYEITYDTSSIKYKTNVTDLTANTSLLHDIRAREYDTKEGNLHRIGYIAEEADLVSTDFTWKNPDGTPEGMEWNNILVYAVEEIKKLHKEVEKLKGENTTLHNEIQELRQLISTS